MKKLTFELEFITPAFIGGADPKDAELRPASFVGLLRWWWRVVLATFIRNTEELFKYESLLFGSQDRAGSVYLRLENVPKASQEMNENFYILGQGARERKYIDARQRFKVVLICEDKYVKLLESLSRLAFNFGGIGYRARKGLGSMYIVGEEETLEVFRPQHWEKILKDTGIKTETPNMDLPNLKNLTILKKTESFTDSDWRDVLGKLGELYREIRLKETKTPEYLSMVYYFLRNQRENINLSRVELNNLPLGLPIMYQSRSLARKEGDKTVRAQAQLTWKLDREDNVSDRRRASTVLFSIKPGNIYALVFKCKFLPEGASLRLQAKGKYWNNSTPKPKDFYIPASIWERGYNTLLNSLIDNLERIGFRRVSI